MTSKQFGLVMALACSTYVAVPAMADRYDAYSSRISSSQRSDQVKEKEDRDRGRADERDDRTSDRGRGSDRADAIDNNPGTLNRFTKPGDYPPPYGITAQPEAQPPYGITPQPQPFQPYGLTGDWSEATTQRVDDRRHRGRHGSYPYHRGGYGAGYGNAYPGYYPPYPSAYYQPPYSVQLYPQNSPYIPPATITGLPSVGYYYPYPPAPCPPSYVYPGGYYPYGNYSYGQATIGGGGFSVTFGGSRYTGR